MILRNIDANLLVALHALLREKNVTRAARRVGREQSSMSHALARLRDHFGDPLLVRAGRGLVLTERAQALIAPVEEAVGMVERVFAASAPFDPRTAARTFHLGTTDNLALYLLPGLVTLLAEEAPSVDLRSHHLPGDWHGALVRGELDLKLGREYELPAGLHAEVLMEERFVCVVRASHPIAKAAPALAPRLSLEAYARLDHVVVAPSAAPGADVRGNVDTALARYGLTRRIALAVSHFLVAPHVVASTDLILTTPERLATPFLRPLGLTVVPLPLELRPYRLTQVWAERAQHEPAHAFLRAAVRRVVSRGGESAPSMEPMPKSHAPAADAPPMLRATRR
ncbi:Transcriptional regulator [Minicystis rosea]|nr:Transcriptional regulator [Minicystis rosea]